MNANVAHLVLLSPSGQKQFFLCVYMIWVVFFNRLLSVPGNYSLRINLEDFDGKQRYAEYKNFKVASEQVLMLNDQ